MQLTLKNKELITFGDVLEKVQVRNMRANRGRAKLLTHVSDKLNEYIKDETDLLQDYMELDENGKFKKDDAGNFVLKDKSKVSEVNELIKELADETIILKGGENSNRYRDFLEYLSDSDDEFTTNEIILIDNILDQYEASKSEKTEE